MGQAWPERQLAMNSLVNMSIGKAQLIYNTDGDLKSSRAPEPGLIRGATGEKGAEAVFAYKLEALWEQSTRILVASGKPGLARKDFKGVNFKEEGFLRVVRTGLTKSYRAKLLRRQFELHIRKQFPGIILIRSTE